MEYFYKIKIRTLMNFLIYILYHNKLFYIIIESLGDECRFIFAEEEKMKLKDIGNEKHFHKYQIKNTANGNIKETTFYYYKR